MEFTWNNKREGFHQVASRVDRFLLSTNLVRYRAIMDSLFILGVGYYHWIIILEIDKHKKTRNHPFRFEIFLLDHPEFMQTLSTWWENPHASQGSKIFKIKQKLKCIKENLKYGPRRYLETYLKQGRSYNKIWPVFNKNPYPLAILKVSYKRKNNYRKR